MKTDTFSLQILRGVSGIERLKSDWNTIFTSVSPRDFYHAYSWHNCYLRHLSTDPDDILFCYISSAELCCQAIVLLEKTSIRYFGVDFCQLRIPSHPHLPLGDVVVSANWTHELPVSWFVRELNTQLPFRWHFLLFDCALPQSNILKLLRHPSKHAQSSSRRDILAISFLTALIPCVLCRRTFDPTCPALGTNWRSSI